MKCPYCSKPIETPVPKKVIYIGFNQTTREKSVCEEVMEFCSSECGQNYQMGCEG